jgi:hypothetical protein
MWWKVLIAVVVLFVIGNIVFIQSDVRRYLRMRRM